MSEAPTFAACGACITVEAAAERSQKAMANDIMLSVPDMHCASCMGKIEDALSNVEGVENVRTNLSLKRVIISTTRPMQAQDFIPRLGKIGYDAYELDQQTLGKGQDEISKNYLLRMGVAGFAMMNVMLMSVSVWTGADASTRDLLHWLSAAITIPTVLYAGQPFFRQALHALKNRSLNMDVPISLAIILALLMSIYETSISGEHAYFDAAISLTFFLLIGRFLDYRTRSQARSAAQELAALESHKAILITPKGDRNIEISKLRIGDNIRILPGARIPVDGIIIKGKSDIDTGLITGESIPEVMQKGDFLRAGTLNLTGMIEIKAQAVGEDTSLRQIAKMVAIAENGRNIYTSLADRAARIYAPLVHLLALTGFLAWFAIAKDWHFAMNVAIAVLVITCPCALGLAVPAVNTASSGKLYQKGLLLKSETAMERLAEIDVVIFDKTGTLTQSQPELLSIDGEHLDIALALAQASQHPLAQALASALHKKGITPATLTNIKEIAGSGIEAHHAQSKVQLGSAQWLGANFDGQGSETWLKANGQLTRFTFQDQLREGAKEAVSRFQSQGVQTWLLSGDRQAPVHALAKRVGIEHIMAEIPAENKARFVRDLKNKGHKVLMVGDGLNDTAALAEADISIAPSNAMDITRNVADIVLVTPQISAVFDAYQLALISKKRIIQNFSLAATYNLIAVPIALMGFATPFLAALAMSSSSIIVVLNANRIRWFK